VATEAVTDRVDLIAHGRAATTSGQWPDAFAALARADAVAPLEPDDLELLGWAAHFSARPEAAVAARQRAFASVRADDPKRAAGIALHIACIHFGRGSLPVGVGWMQQAADLLIDQGECDEAVWLAWIQAVMASESGQFDVALAAVDEVIESARQRRVTDVDALATLLKGQLLTRQGFPVEGARLIDPVMALAVGGCLGQFAAAWVYCGTISMCTATGDLERAWEWTNEVGRCGVTGPSDFPGDCRLHRAEMLRIRGEWTKAEIETASVCDELGSWHSGHVAIAHYELGEISLRRGDLTAAAEAFAHCRELGHTPLPGMASLELAAGNPEAARALVLDELSTTSDPPYRSKLLPVAIESMLACGRIDDAHAATQDLRSLAGTWVAPLHQARAAHAEGAMALAAGNKAEAQRHLGEAVGWWKKVPAPYDEAVSQALWARAEESTAQTMHLEAALETFQRLGAVADTQRVLHDLRRDEETSRVTETLMFTDIEGSTTMLAQLGDAAWVKVLRRHDRALRDLFGRHGGKELTGTGDGFFVGFSTPDSALECALAIQDTVEEVKVRVGVHFTEVNLDSSGLSGRGVHEAARISALGAGGDIVVSRATLDRAAKSYRTRETRMVSLKGLPGETEVAYLAWGSDVD
jgi:class 3 adenylate cyclase